MGACSTPYGIRGRNTEASTAIFLLGGRCSTPYGIRGRNTDPNAFVEEAWQYGAQRLTASEVETLFLASLDNLCHLSAQRLTASEVETRRATR